MENSNKENTNLKGSKIIRFFGTLLGVISIVTLFILLGNGSKFTGNSVFIFPVVLVLGLFFSSIGVTGRVKDSAKYLGFIILFVLAIILLSYLFRFIKFGY